MNLPRERENPVRNSTVELLSPMGITLWRRNVGAFHVDDRFIRCAEPGQSDLWGYDWPRGSEWSRHWEIETKATGKRPTPAQLIWLKASTARGWVAFWADNVDTIVRVARATLDGGKIVWGQGDAFDVQFSDRCEHMVLDGNWCPECNQAMKASLKENDASML